MGTTIARKDGVLPGGVDGGIGRHALRHCRADQRATAGRLTIVAQLPDAYQRHVSGALDGLLVVLIEQRRDDEADDGVVVRECGGKHGRTH